MPGIMHVIDGGTDGESLDQLALLARESEPIISIGPPPSSRKMEDGLEERVRSIRLSITDRISLTRSLRRRLGGAEIVHAWSPSACPAARVIARQFDCPLVVSMPHYDQRHPPRGARNCTGDAGVHVTVPTQAARDRLIRAGTVPDKLHVLPPAAAGCGARDELRRQARRSLGLNDSHFLLVAPVPMVRGAGNKIAGWAYVIVRQVVPHVRLLFPRTGPVERNVRFFVGAIACKTEVFFAAGTVSSACALAAADVAVFFFEWDVGVSSLARAMAAGVPIAASATPDAAECAPHEQAALLVEPGDPRSASAAVLRLIEEPQLARRLADGALDLARERFDPDRTRKQLEAIYADAM